MSWILHMSDPHLGDVPGKLDDDKVVITNQPDLETSQSIFLRTLRTIAPFVKQNGKPALVLVSGDLTFRCRDSGFQAFKELLAQRADLLPEDPAAIVVVPGNHDVAWDEKPASKGRYASFLAVTRALGCTTPLIDGIDFDEETAALKPESRRHPHHAVAGGALAIALNSSNFCGVEVTPRDGWTSEQWASSLKSKGLSSDSELVDQVKKLHQQDIARISKPQVEALAAYFADLGLDSDPASGPLLRVAVLHHQLLPLSTREERKPFESMVSLQMVRHLLRDYGVRIVLHGHKHESGLYWHSVGSDNEDHSGHHPTGCSSSPPRTVRRERPDDARDHAERHRARAERRIFTIRLSTPRARAAQRLATRLSGIWQAEMEAEQRPPTVIAGTNMHTAYARTDRCSRSKANTHGRTSCARSTDPSDAPVLPPRLP